MSSGLSRQKLSIPSFAAIVLLALITLQGCSAEADDSAMPEVVGKNLQVAQSDIKRAGYQEDIEILGGGIFGILDESKWDVCEQLPTAGEPFAVQPRLTVARSCDDDEPVAVAPRKRPEETSTPSADAEPTPEEESPKPSPEPKSTPTPTPEPAVIEEDESASADEVEARFLDHLENNFIDSIASMCDPAYTHWACFYDGVEGNTGMYLRVLLTTDGGWSEGALSDMATETGRHWYNFIGCDYPELTTIVVQINGIDHNVFKSSIQTMC